MKTKILFSITMFALLATGCSLDREYMNGPKASTFPSSKSEVEAGVFSAYKSLTLLDASSTPYPGVQDNCTDIGAARINSTYTDQVLSKIALSNVFVEKTYTVIYKGAARTNIVLDEIDNIRHLLTDQEYNMYKSELLLIRSYLFDMGCQFFGDLPYIDHTLALGETYSRTPRAEVIDNILNKDLRDEMLDYLPLRHSKDAYGSARLGRVGAYALKARICLNWGHFEDAAKYADKALKLASEAGYDLEPFNTTYCGKDHTEGEPDITNLFGINGHKNSKEWIWALQFNSTISSNQHNAGYYSAPRIAGGCSYFGPTQIFIDALQCTDGKSIAESPLYNWKQPWKNRDPRLDLYCVRPDSRVLNIEFQTNPSIQKIRDYKIQLAPGDDIEKGKIANSEAYGTKSEYGTNGSKGPAGYLWRKYIDIQEAKANGGSFGTGSACTMNYPLMRLAELYLIRAEANIEWVGGDLGQAKSDIEAIRARANMPALTSSSREALRSALRYERMVELCDEGFRWFDIRRWDIAEVVVSGKLYAPALDGSMSNAKPLIDHNWHASYLGETFDGEKLNLRTFATMVFDPLKDYLWPIPEAERVAMPSLPQNPGYSGAITED